MDHKNLVEEIKAFLSNCEQVRYGELVGAPWPYNHDGPMVYTEPEDILLDQSATAITDLLARAEAAEKERDWLKMCFDLAQRKEKEAEAKAEKAKAELNVAVSDLETVMAYGNFDACQLCKNGQCYISGGTKPCLPKWRGQEEE